MGGLYAYLAGADSTAIYQRLDTLARHNHTPGDHRTADQRRADVLRDLLLGTPTPPHTGTAPHTRTAHPPAPAPAPAPAGTAQHHRRHRAPHRRHRAHRRARRAWRVRLRARAARQGCVSAQVQVTIAATTLAGLDDQPAELAGYGPILASIGPATSPRTAPGGGCSPTRSPAP